MKQHSSGFIIGIVASIILGFGIVAGIWLGLSSISGPVWCKQPERVLTAQHSNSPRIRTLMYATPTHQRRKPSG